MPAAAPLVVLIPLLYLAWRIAGLWSAPLQVIFRYLQIDLPASPRLTVDALTAESVSLHWAPPELSAVKKHIIRMDGQEVGVSVRGETSVTISGLTADYLYSIQVIAVNAHGFQVASPLFYVKTRPRPKSAAEMEAAVAAAAPGAGEQDQDGTLVTGGAPTTSDAGSTAVRMPKKRASLDILKPKEPSPAAAQKFAQDEAEAIAALTQKMDKILKETLDIDAQIAGLNGHHAKEEQTYAAKLDDWRQKKKGEDDARAARDQHHKQLDQQKREIETRRNQVQKALKQAQDEFRKQCADVAGFTEVMQQAAKESEALAHKTQQLTVEADDAIASSERAGALALEELAEVEAEIRYLLARKTEGEADLARLQSESRVASPSPQEVAEAAKDDAQWKEREETLVRQYDEASQLLNRLQQGFRSGTPISDGSSDNPGGSMRRRKSRKNKEPADPRYSMPAFNPDAAPFVAANATNNTSTGATFFTENMGFGGSHAYDVTNHPNPAPGLGREAPGPPSVPGVTSIFNDDTLFPRRSSPFSSTINTGMPTQTSLGRRDSPRSSQSGSNPSSPSVANPNLHTQSSFGMLPSIFNAGASHHLNSALQLERERNGQRVPSSSLVSSLNGVPLGDSPEHSAGSSAQGSVHNLQLGLGVGSGIGILGKERPIGNNGGNLVGVGGVVGGSSGLQPTGQGTNSGTSKWFWPSSSKKIPVSTGDPLALDRKNTRSLPKADVAPIGTRRARSGSLRGEDAAVAAVALHGAAPAGSRLSRAYADAERQAHAGMPPPGFSISRTASPDHVFAGLPREPTAVGAVHAGFGWDAMLTAATQKSATATHDPWQAHHETGQSTTTSFDPFAGLPKLPASNNATVSGPILRERPVEEIERLLLSPDPESDAESPFFAPKEPVYHTTIDASMLNGGNLQREISNASSRKSTGSGEGGRRKLVGSGKQFTSFVGRVFGNNKNGDAA